MSIFQVYAGVLCSTGWVLALFWSLQMYKKSFYLISEVKGLNLGLQRLDPTGFYGCLKAFEDRMMKSEHLKPIWEMIKIHLIIPSRYATITVVRCTQPITEIVIGTRSELVNDVIKSVDNSYRSIVFALASSLLLPFLITNLLFTEQKISGDLLSSWMFIPILGAGIGSFGHYSLRKSAVTRIQQELKALSQVLEKVIPYVSVQQSSMLPLQETREAIQALQEISTQIERDKRNTRSALDSTSKTPTITTRISEKSWILGGQKGESEDITRQFNNLKLALSSSSGERRRDD